MAQDTFTPEQIENLKGHFRSMIKDIVLEMLLDIMKISSSIIPSVIKEITPKIIESIKECLIVAQPNCDNYLSLASAYAEDFMIYIDSMGPKDHK